MFGMANPQMQFSQQAAQPPIRQPQFMGQWLSAGNYQEMLTLPIPLNGAPVLVSLTDEPVVYILQMQNGQKVLSGFSITPLPGVTNNTSPQTETAKNSELEQRLDNIEKALSTLANPKTRHMNDNGEEAAGREKSVTPIA